MAYREIRGNLFATKAEALVNTVNCVGVMGKGVALEFRLRFPEMFKEYQRICANGLLRPGQIWPYRKQQPWILNFAVKSDWRFPSKIEWVESCLVKFAQSYRQLGIRSVAMPWLGAMNGRLDWSEVHELIRTHLAHLDDIEIELVEFDPHAPDPLFERLQDFVVKAEPGELSKHAGLTENAAFTIADAVRKGQTKSLAEVAALDSLGKTSIERLYTFLRHLSTPTHALGVQSQLL